MNDDLLWLLKWYSKQCDGDWEHGNGIEIGTIDNPGWYLKICLDETELQNKPFKEIKIDRSESDWVRCYIKDEVFEGVGGLFNLPEVFQAFRKWAEAKREGG
jgi:hypothetical protein